MRKNKTDHNCGIGRSARAVRYTTNAKTDPNETTSLILTPSSWDKKPQMLKITKPKEMEVMQFVTVMKTACLKIYRDFAVDDSYTETYIVINMNMVFCVS